MYYFIYEIRDVVRGLHTGNPLTCRLRVHAGRQGGDSLVSGAGKRWSRYESKGII
jgi:hypothetical protein